MITEKVSIIMPAYNVGKYIADTIKSVLSQQYAYWELLIIDDGSTDNTREVVQTFKDGRIKMFTQPNVGVSAARNKGLEQMSGSFFCFLDADDIMPPASISSRMVLFGQNPGLSFADGRVLIKNEDLTDVLRIYLPSFKGFPLKQLIRLSKSCFLGNTWMIKRQSGVKYSFTPDITHGEDLLFYIRYAEQGMYDFTNEDVLVYRRRGDSAMANLKGLQQGYEHLYRTVKTEVHNKSWGDMLFLKYKITRIMFLSNLSAGKPVTALKSLFSNFLLG